MVEPEPVRSLAKKYRLRNTGWEAAKSGAARGVYILHLGSGNVGAGARAGAGQEKTRSRSKVDSATLQVHVHFTMYMYIVQVHDQNRIGT